MSTVLAVLFVTELAENVAVASQPDRPPSQTCLPKPFRRKLEQEREPVEQVLVLSSTLYRRSPPLFRR